MQESYLTYLNGPDIAGLNMSDAEILAAVEESLRAQGLGQTRIEPRVHLVPEDQGSFQRAARLYPAPACGGRQDCRRLCG